MRLNQIIPFEIHKTYWIELRRENGIVAYPAGTPVLSIYTNSLKAIRIYRYYVTIAGTYSAPTDITGPFLRFQRRCRQWFFIRRRAFRWVRARELGRPHVVHNLTDLYGGRFDPPFRRLNKPIMSIRNS